MSVEFNCPVCNQALQAADADRGRRTRCAGCQSIVTIPPAAGTAASAHPKPEPEQPKPTTPPKANPTHPSLIKPPPSPPPTPPQHPAPPKPAGHPTPAATSPTAPSITAAAPPTATKRRRRPKAASYTPPQLRSKLQQDDEIDMTPMIDVVFQLLIFFMVTSAYAMQKVLPVPTPESTEAAAQQVVPSEESDDVLTVRVDADDVLWVEDVQAIGRQDLIAKLRKARTQPGPAGEPPPKRMLVRADPDAHHAAVVTALDAGSIAGMEEVRLATDAESP